MCEKFNSGYGGYICDHCRVLLWAGRNGSENPENRRFIYSTKPEDIVELGGLFFCSQACADKGEE